MPPAPRIGIDAMGGDFGPLPVAEGAASALRQYPGRVQLTLVGDEPEIRAALRRAGAERLPVEIVHAAGKVDMGAKAAAVARRSDTSLGVLTQLHKERRVDAIFACIFESRHGIQPGAANNCKSYLFGHEDLHLR
jgi:glycerol-3-phosphate acyltransferase PlsX